MARMQVHRITVEFDDCDPAQIAFFANFFRWYDAASRHFFEKCGVPPWRERQTDAETLDGLVGAPGVVFGTQQDLMRILAIQTGGRHLSPSPRHPHLLDSGFLFRSNHPDPRLAMNFRDLRDD